MNATRVSLNKKLLSIKTKKEYITILLNSILALQVANNVINISLNGNDIVLILESNDQADEYYIEIYRFWENYLGDK